MLRVLLPFFGGVYAGIHPESGIELSPVLIILPLFTAAAFLVFKRQKGRASSLPWLNPILLFLVIFLAGVGSAIVVRPGDPGLPEDRWVLVRGYLSGSAVPGRHGYVFDMKVQQICSADSIHQVKTRLKCYMPEPPDSLLPAAGQTWQFCGKLEGIQNSRNPGTPDFRAIMGRKNCWYRFYISSSAITLLHNREVETPERKFASARIRHLVSKHWQGGAEELSLLRAVCLGDRSSLSENLQQAYTNAGGMHLLAVSGLHVGLIWWVLQHMTSWLGLIFRKGFMQNLLVVGLLWFYAFLTGFSSSVCRSVTMFSFFSVSLMRGEKTPALNVIAASAFLLVLIDPPRLMDVGFQLSYAAITGIVSLHPMILGLLRVKHRVLRWIWEAASVSFAAQLATAPLVIYYFHQLPLYSLITSLVAIPLLSILIALFVSSVPLVAAGILERASSFLLVLMARFMNSSVEFLGGLPGAVLDELYLGPVGLLVWLLMFLLLALYLRGRNRLPVYLMLLLLSLYLSWNTCNGVKQKSGSQLLITHFYGSSMLSIRRGAYVDHYCWYKDSTSLNYMEEYRKQHWNRRIYTNRLVELDEEQRASGGTSSCIRIDDGTWLIGAPGLRGLVLYGPEFSKLPDPLSGELILDGGLRPDFILLSGEPYVDVGHLAQSFDKVTLVIDGSNRSWYKKHLASEADHIYLTDLAGAYAKRW